MSQLHELDFNQLSIFLLHGVVEKSNYQVRNYTSKHLDLAVFIEYMQNFKRIGHAMSMDQVVDYLTEKKPFPPNSFAVTFDDGFENNFSVAMPVLEALEIPATFYITTGFIQENKMSWIDRIEYCFEMSQSVTIQLPWRNEFIEMCDPKSKIALLTEIRDQVKNSAAINPEYFADDICRQSGFEQLKSSQDPLDLKLSWEQIQTLHAHPLFTIGGHTHTHAILSFLGPEDLNFEVKTSLDLLKSFAQVQTNHFSYPEGLSHCYNSEVIKCLKSHGIVCSPSAEAGRNPQGTDLFHLKRINLT